MSDAPSLCEFCTDPGRCCRNFNVGTVWADDFEAKVKRLGWPFEVIKTEGPWYDDESGRDYIRPWFRCPKLDQRTGRCTIYDARPELCRTYEPAMNGLCVFHASRWSNAKDIEECAT